MGLTVKHTGPQGSLKTCCNTRTQSLSLIIQLHYNSCYRWLPLSLALLLSTVALPSTIGSTLYYWLYPLLLALPSATGSTLYYWLYPLLLALPSATGYWLYPLLLALPSTIGSTLCYWLYPLLLALPSATGSTLYHHRLYTIYPRPCGTSNV